MVRHKAYLYDKHKMKPAKPLPAVIPHAMLYTT